VSVTNNNITTAENIIHRYKNMYKAELETMEGAAFHYVGIMHNLPFIQIRGISNYVGERNKNAWKINEALDAATQGCLNLLDQL
jgi:futalosine hydrolase